MKYGTLNFLELSGPLQACNGAALRFYPVILCVFVFRELFFDYEGWIKKITLYSDIDRSGVCCILNSGSSGNSAQNETDVTKIYFR